MIYCRPASSIFRSCVQASHFSTVSNLSRKNAHLLPLVCKTHQIYSLVPFPIQKTMSPARRDEIFHNVVEMAIACELHKPDMASELIQDGPMAQHTGKEMDAALGKTIAAASREWGFVYRGGEKKRYPDSFRSVGTPDSPHAYTLKEGMKPSDGLERFLKGPTTTDCGGVVEAVFFKTIADVIGQERFDTLFSHPILQLRFQSGGTWALGSLLHLFTQPAHTNFSASDRSHITIGTRVYFQGIPWYGIKHPTGFGHGHHVIHTGCSSNGQRLYWGFGFKNPLPEEGIHRLLLDEYNRPRSEEDARFVKKLSPEEFKKLMLEAHASKIKGFEKEIDRCYDNPNETCSMEKAHDAGLGFYGYVTACKLSPTTLGFIKRTPLERLKSPGFPSTLSLLQALRIGHLAIDSVRFQHDSISSTSKEAKHFERWCGIKHIS